ncbi:MAG: HAMP domain-containing sensor histidine kinase [Gammaproteobacteria bacterium]|nr:HAMP domain-containing sensor histidine kinase [Gammaproteobacteria bacterium]
MPVLIADDIRNETDPLGKITISTLLVNNDVEIRITDSGCGMPEDVSKRIFEPFYTTKGVGKGTGQGLAIAYAVIVDKHKGTISVDSKFGKGTTFIIHLPMVVQIENLEIDESEPKNTKSGVM